MEIDTKKLEALAERVSKKCKEINSEDALPISKDSAWAELVSEALPELVSYLIE